MADLRHFLILTFLFANHFRSSSADETTVSPTIDLKVSPDKDNAREIVAKISILENKILTTPLSGANMKQVDIQFSEIDKILEKLEGEDKDLYTKIVGKLKEKFEKIKTQFSAYYEVYQLNEEIEKKMIALENILANLPQRNLHPIFSKVNESLECVKDSELKLNDDFFHHKLDKAFFEIRKALHQLRKLDFLEKQIDSLDTSISKLFTLFREMYYGEKNKLISMGKFIEQSAATQ